MKLRFKHQKFQADAANAVCDVFEGQPFLQRQYKVDTGIEESELDAVLGFQNAPIVPSLSDNLILKQLNRIQRDQLLKPSAKLEGRYNLTVEMETGVGKTYTYIKTMYELNRRYGWSKFIVVVPSIAIREGVFKTFQVTEEHFVMEYGTRIRYFIYNSKKLNDLEEFAGASSINVMIINAQAFNAKGKDARRIYMELDEFRSRRPIDIIAKTNPILIIDEPQSVEGKQTREQLKLFNPLLTLRYSATHRADSVYNMVYRLDAQDAYNKRLVKKISVKGISQIGSTATDGYIYLQSINLSKSAPTATIQIEAKTSTGVKRKTVVVNEGYNIYEHSGALEEYHHGYVVTSIDGRDNSIELLNGKKLYAGDVLGNVNEEQLRRLQIRETIISHFDRERQLFNRGIKVLSLFFIDEVKNYRVNKESERGIFARMFEEEYQDVLDNWQFELEDEYYIQYVKNISAEETHAGYFSQDKKGDFINSKESKKEGASDDVDAYTLIMKRKELLLDYNHPVRFIFSHSALREGWDNPNVFQICTLKQSSSEVRKRQEVGRGLRLAVNQRGERMDESILGGDVHSVNVLTVVASESYEAFAKGLQTELAEAVSSRPRKVTLSLFEKQAVKNAQGVEVIIDQPTATKIYNSLIRQDYVNDEGMLTEKFYADLSQDIVVLPESVEEYRESILKILDSVYNNNIPKPDNARANNIELRINEKRFAMPEFKALWNRINAKSVYEVNFDPQELIQKAIVALDNKLNVTKVRFEVVTGHMEDIDKDKLISGQAFVVSEKSKGKSVSVKASKAIKYDLVGKLVEKTGLTRNDVVSILTGINALTFAQYKQNPEEFIIKASNLINEEKATVIIEHITYHMREERYERDIFTDATIKGRLHQNALKANKHLYDHVIYGSDTEKRFAEDLDTCKDVAVYVKLPNGFYITTPVGTYNPDWAIAFYEGDVKHIFFVAETKGAMSSMQLRLIEKSKIHCARQHFKAISGEKVRYDVVDSYESLMNLLRK